MKLNRWRWGRAKNTDQLTDVLPEIESVLESTFQPVSPRPDFVSMLKTQLEDPNIINQRRILSYKQVMFLLLALTTTVFMAVGFVKLFIELLSALRLVFLFSPQASKKFP